MVSSGNLVLPIYLSLITSSMLMVSYQKQIVEDIRISQVEI